MDAHECLMQKSMEVYGHPYLNYVMVMTMNSLLTIVRVHGLRKHSLAHGFTVLCMDVDHGLF